MNDQGTAINTPMALTVVPAVPTIETLLVTAIERGVPVETMEKLMAMRRELKAEAAKESYYKSLSAFQAACPTIQKHREVKVNGQVRYRYAALEDIIAQVGPLLETHGLSYRFDTQLDNGFLHITCIVSHREGHSEASQFRVPIEKSGRMNYTQEFGSSSTYAKRYCFCNALGILTGDTDDDGNAAGKPAKAARSDSEHREAESPVSPSKAAPKATADAKKATPEGNAAAIDDFNQRCKARLVEVARKSKWPGAWKQYAVEVGWILPNEELDVIVRNPVPIFKFDPAQTPTANQIIAAKAFQDIQGNVEALANKLAGDSAERPEMFADEPSEPPQASECPNCNRHLGQESKELVDVHVCQGCGYQWDSNTREYIEEHDWLRAVCPIPPKGMTRLEYLKAPQTLGMIFRTDSKRAYGIVINHTEAKPWKDKNGHERPASAQDQEFAAACRDAVQYMEKKKHPPL